MSCAVLPLPGGSGQAISYGATACPTGSGPAAKQWVLGEDSGLVVPGLGGRPGVYSARYAGKQGDDAANNARLLAELKPLPPDRRAAYYVCSVALADPAGEVRAAAEGRCHGVIIDEPQGTG